ncbi:kinase-like domain, phloem protein 2-like protein [Tanacetum coccineum]
MFDISKLNIEIKTNAQLLSPNVAYGVYLVFKLSDSRKFSSKPVYVNLKYRNGLQSLHAYFATWRDNEWMMIELYQFLNQNEDIVFDFLIESFSSNYCGDGVIYVEGIEFRAIDKVKHKEIGKLKEVQQVLKSNFNVDQMQHFPTSFEEIFKICRNYDELFWLGEINEKKLLVLSAKAVLYKFSNVDLYTSKQLAESRFQEVIELLPQQVFHLNFTIKSQMLSQDTKYGCYLVFKLLEKCQGLHFPVKVRDVLHKENNEAEFVYFINPSALNINGFTRVPKQREDGWMEIQVWKFNSAHEFKDDSLSIDMKFTSLEGPMSGLIVCGLEFRPISRSHSTLFRYGYDMALHLVCYVFFYHVPSDSHRLELLQAHDLESEGAHQFHLEVYGDWINTCFVRNLEGVDLLTGSRGTNPYTINLHDMVSSSSICLVTSATSTHSWLWHRRLSHLNFATFSQLAKDNLAIGLPNSNIQKINLSILRTKKVMETVNVKFDDSRPRRLNQRTLNHALQRMASSTLSDLDHLFEMMYDDYMGTQPDAQQIAPPVPLSAALLPQNLNTPFASTMVELQAPTPTNSSTDLTNIASTSKMLKSKKNKKMKLTMIMIHYGMTMPLSTPLLSVNKID